MIIMLFQASITILEIFALCLPDVQSWHSVTYSSTKVCGLKGASVVLPCRYDYSGIGHYVGGEWYKETGRVWEYNNPPYPDCSLKIEKLSDDDSGLYKFRFPTALHLRWITDHSGVTLSVTDLQVKEDAVVGNQNLTKLTCSTSCSLGSQYVWYRNGQQLQNKTTAFITLDSTKPSDAASYSCAVRRYEKRSPQVFLQVTMTPETVIEGGNVTLTCSSTLSNDLTFIWYKNRRHVSNKHTSTDNKLHLNPVSREDAGNYSCAVRGHESICSTNISLNVRYVPKNVSVFISAFGEIEEGSSVTLTCSSDANPPVHTYTWYMESGAESLVRGTGESISFNVTSDTSGFCYCEAQNEVGSQNSSGVTITMDEKSTATMAIQAGIILTIIVLIILVFTIVSISLYSHRSTEETPQVTRSRTRIKRGDVYLDAHGDPYTRTSPVYGNLQVTFQNVRTVNDPSMPLQRRIQDSVYENLQSIDTPQTETELRDPFRMKCSTSCDVQTLLLH